ncbi:hypothetical protein B566_EDAN003557 [Ephemera danica]|nr:hypothetical protein B566_EDAN003557 [Ephemera danica]
MDTIKPKASNMGAYLEKPVTSITSETGHDAYFEYAAASMQGWRVSQEISLFGVYDGHGGREVSIYCKEALPNHLKNTPEYAQGKMEECFRRGFLSFDASLRNRLPKKQDAPEDFNILLKEANMPLSDVMAGYRMRLATGEGGSSAPDQPFEAGNSDDSDEPDQRPMYNIIKRKDLPPVKPQPENINGNAEEGSAASGSNGEVPTANTSNEAEQGGSSAVKKGKATAKTVSPGSQKAPLKPSQGVATALTKAEGDLSSTSDSEDSDEEGGSSSGDEIEEEEEEDSDDSEPPTLIVDDDDDPGVDSGSTAVVAFLSKEKVIVANIGDSRAILGRLVASTDPDEPKPKLVAVELSHDHKPELLEERKRIEGAGGTVDEEGRINGGLNLSRAFEGDAFLFLACDGIWNEMSTDAAANFIWQNMEAGFSLETILKRQKSAEELAALALAKESADSKKQSSTFPDSKDSSLEGDVFIDDTPQPGDAGDTSTSGASVQEIPLDAPTSTATSQSSMVDF